MSIEGNNYINSFRTGLSSSGVGEDKTKELKDDDIKLLFETADAADGHVDGKIDPDKGLFEQLKTSYGIDDPETIEKNFSSALKEYGESYGSVDTDDIGEEGAAVLNATGNSTQLSDEVKALIKDVIAGKEQLSTKDKKGNIIRHALLKNMDDATYKKVVVEIGKGLMNGNSSSVSNSKVNTEGASQNATAKNSTTSSNTPASSNTASSSNVTASSNNAEGASQNSTTPTNTPASSGATTPTNSSEGAKSKPKTLEEEIASEAKDLSTKKTQITNQLGVINAKIDELKKNKPKGWEAEKKELEELKKKKEAEYKETLKAMGQKTQNSKNEFVSGLVNIGTQFVSTPVRTAITVGKTLLGFLGIKL